MSGLTSATDKRALLDFPPIEIPGSASRDITKVTGCNRNVALIIWSYCKPFAPDFRQVNYPLRTLGNALVSKDPFEIFEFYNAVRKVMDTFTHHLSEACPAANISNQSEEGENEKRTKVVEQLLAPGIPNFDPEQFIYITLPGMHDFNYHQGTLDLFETAVPEKCQLNAMLYRLTRISLLVVSRYLLSPLARSSFTTKHLDLYMQKKAPRTTALHVINTFRFCLLPEDFGVLDETHLIHGEMPGYSFTDSYQKEYPKAHALFSQFLTYEQERSDYLELQTPQTTRVATFASDTSSVSDKIGILNGRTAAEKPALSDQKPSTKTFQWTVKQLPVARLS